LTVVRGVVGASVTAGGVLPWDVSVGADELTEEGSESGIGEVGEDGDVRSTTGGKVTSHIELHHTSDLDTPGFVSLSNVLRSQKTGFFGSEPLANIK
jgi:hypothetical protein